MPEWLRRLDDTPPWAGLGLGGLIGFGLAWGTLELGPWAAVPFALGLGGLALGLGARVRLAGEPRRRPPAPPPPLPDLPPLSEQARPETPAAGPVVRESPVPPPLPDPDPLPAMAELPGGTFWMGSDKGLDPSAYDDEMPRRRVRVSPFLIARTPITRGLWRRVMAAAPKPWRRPVPGTWQSGDDDLPATGVSWFDALAFCNALSLQSGHRPCYQGSGEDWTCDWQADGYRLPTEAEWEYACRGGKETRWFWGDDEGAAGEHAWFSGNSRDRLHPVGGKTPNRFGLHDMAGNCWEWCWDRWAERYDARETQDPRGPAEGRLRVLRGGSAWLGPGYLRSADRNGVVPGVRDRDIGCRCVRSAPRTPGNSPS